MRIQLPLILLISGTLFISCSSMHIVTIDSQPQGASVIADGEEIGKTPLKVEADEAFPPRWVGTSYMVKSKLELKKSDCEPVTMKINDTVLSRDISLKLKCSNTQVSPSSTTTNPQKEKPLKANDTFSQRLEELNTLHEKGLVTDKEFKTQRQRILNEL